MLNIISIMIMQVMLLILALYSLNKKPFDIGTILVLLSILFYFFPAWDFYFGGQLFSLNILNYRVGYENDTEGLYLIFMTTLIMVAFYIFYFVTTYINKKQINIEVEFKVNYHNLRIAQFIILMVWIFVFLYSFSRYDQNILLFFAPSRKEGIFDSAYLLLLYKLLPVAFVMLRIFREYLEDGKIKKITYLILLFPLMAYMTTGQRREIINFILLIVLLLIHFKFDRKKLANKFRISKYYRKKIYQIGFMSVLLIPVLWWGRVIFSQLQRNDSNIIPPWERRGFLELLFGSSSGGFRTLLLGLEYQELFGLTWGYSLYFFITSFIPRSLLEDKPQIINKLWQDGFGLTGNPSTFYINEMYINFGISSIFFSAIFGMLLAYIYHKLYNSPNILHNLYSFIIFSNVITLFKNGFIQFIINTGMAIIIIGIPLIFVMKRTKGG